MGAAGAVAAPHAQRVVGGTGGEELSSAAQKVRGGDRAVVCSGQRGDALAALEMPDVKLPARRRGDEQRLAVGAEGERVARVAGVVRKRDDGAIHLQIMHDDAAVGEASADDVEGRGLPNVRTAERQPANS